MAIAAIETAPVFGYSLVSVKDAPHPNAARLLLDFFTGPIGSSIYADAKVIGNYNPEVGSKAIANSYYKQFGLNLVPMPADIYTPENTAWATRFWMTDLWK